MPIVKAVNIVSRLNDMMRMSVKTKTSWLYVQSICTFGCEFVSSKIENVLFYSKLISHPLSKLSADDRHVRLEKCQSKRMLKVGWQSTPKKSKRRSQGKLSVYVMIAIDSHLLFSIFFLKYSFFPQESNCKIRIFCPNFLLSSWWSLSIIFNKIRSIV